MNAFVSGFCGCAGAIVAAMLAALIWILIKECLGIKPKSQADINSRSLDALLERNELTRDTNRRIAHVVVELAGIADRLRGFAPDEDAVAHINGETGSTAA